MEKQFFTGSQRSPYRILSGQKILAEPPVRPLGQGFFGGISRFDAAFLLLWLAAAIFRFGFIVRAVRLLCERLAEGPVNAEVAR